MLVYLSSPSGKKWPVPAPMIALVSLTDKSVVFDKLRQDKSRQPLTCQGSVSVDSEAPDIVFICSRVDYGIHAYIKAVR